MTVTIDAVHLVEMAARWRAAVPNVGMVCEAHGKPPAVGEGMVATLLVCASELDDLVAAQAEHEEGL